MKTDECESGSEIPQEHPISDVFENLKEALK
jgi:hypothetical protein